MEELWQVTDSLEQRSSITRPRCFNTLRRITPNRRSICSLSTNGLLVNRYLIFAAFILCCLIATGYSTAIKTGCRKHGTQHVIDEPGCDLVAVNINMCSGYCMSFSFPNPGENSITVHGKCCRMVDTEWIEVKVNCDDGERKMKIPSAVECRCFDCA